MKFYNEGDTSKAICDHCNGLVTTTFKYAPIKYKEYTIDNILQGFCDTCGASLSLPHQSTYKIQSYISSHEKRATKKKEYRVPNELVDVLNTIGFSKHLSSKTNKSFRILSRYYIDHLNNNEDQYSRDMIKTEILSPFINKKHSNSRISCSFDEDYYDMFEILCEKYDVKGPDLLKSFIIMAKKDFLDNNNPKELEKLKEIALELS